MSKRRSWLPLFALAAGAVAVVSPVGSATAAPVPVAVYSAIDSPMPGNVASLGFQATQTSAFGDLVQLAPGPRRLDSVTVMMSSWGCETGGWSTAATDPCVTASGATFSHPLTLSLYNSAPGTPTGVGTQLLTVTRTFAIPYRPSADPTCTAGDAGKWRSGSTCYNGFATPVTFTFDGSTNLPTNVIWTLGYNTTSYGIEPMTTSAPCFTESGGCGYDSLNVGLSTQAAPAAGVDLVPSSAVASAGTNGVDCAGGSNTLRVTVAGCWTGYRPMAEITTLALSDTTTTRVVNAADTSWAFFTESTVGGQSGAYVTGPATPPLGTGSAQLEVTASNQGQVLGTSMLGGTRLARLTALRYSSEQPSGVAAPSLQFPVRYDGLAGAYQGRLVFEPIYTLGAGPVPAGWQTWNTLAGKWWATGAPGNTVCNTGTPCTWSQLLVAFPDAVINPSGAGVLLKVGSGISSFTGHVDALTIGVDDGVGNIVTTTYDFEPTAQCTTTCYVDAATGNDLNGGTSTVDPKRTIQAAVTQVSPSGTVIVAAGTYGEDVTIAETLTLQGAGIGQSIVSGPLGGGNSTILVQAPNVIVDGFTITRQATSANWQGAINTAGLSVNGLTNNVEIRRSRFVQNRTAIDINNSNGTRVIDNVIEDNRTGIILWNNTDNTLATGNVIADNWTLGVLFGDQTGGTNSPAQTSIGTSFRNNSIYGNWYGGVVDRQFVTSPTYPTPGTTNLKNFSNNWWGTPHPVVTSSNPAEPSYVSAPIPPPNGSATNPGGAPDIAGPGAANIDFSPRLASGTDSAPGVTGFQGSFAELIVTADGAQTGVVTRIQEGVTDVVSGGIVRVRSGGYTHPVATTISKPLSLLGPNAGISPNGASNPLVANASRVAEATIAPAAGGVAVNVASPSVSIDGFRFTDPGTSGASNVAIIGGGGNFGGDASGLVVQNNVFDAITRIGVYTNGPTTMTGVTVADNRVTNPTRAAGCGTSPAVATGSCGRQLFNLWQIDDVSFTDNVVVAPAANGDRVRVLQVAFPNAASLQADSPTDNVVIAGNTIRNSCVYTCFTLGKGAANVSIVENDVEVDVGNIVQMHPTWTGGRVQIDHNDFAATAGAAVIVEGVVGTDPSGITVTRNSITAGGVADNLPAPVAAPCNWWGQSSGPYSGQNLGAVTAVDSLTTDNLDAQCPALPVAPPPASGVPDFNPVTPTRVFDTRVGTPGHLRDVAKRRVAPGSPLEVKLTDLPGLVPASGVGAVSINVTSTQSQGDGYITVNPCGVENTVSNLNFRRGMDRANAVITAVSATGTVCITSSVATDVVVDVNGWFKSPPSLHPVDPTRVFDTRAGAPRTLRDVPKTRLEPGKRLEVKVTDLPGGLVPASGVGAVSINVTSTRSLSDGFVTVSPCTTDDAVSNVNFQADDDAANLVVAPVSATGTVCFTASAATDLAVDINGWMPERSGFTPVNPTRVADTRAGSVALRDVPGVRVAPGDTLEVELTDLPGLVPAAGVGAVSLSVTSTRSLGDGFLTVSPCGSVNVVSNVNFQGGRDRANAVLTPISASGTVCITASQPTDVIVDVNGWFSDSPTV